MAIFLTGLVLMLLALLFIFQLVIDGWRRFAYAIFTVFWLVFTSEKTIPNNFLTLSVILLTMEALFLLINIILYRVHK